MKRLLLILIISFFSPVMSMQRVLQSTKNVKLKNNMHVCLNTPQRNFGTTHFILGHKNVPQVPVKTVKTERIQVNTQPYVINGNSAHLIDESRSAQAFFTTIHDITSIVLKVLDEARESITVAAFTLTDVRIAQALIAAQKKGVDVCVIVDGGKMKERYSKAQKLIDDGISVWSYDCSLRPHYKKKDWSEPLMHHKCFVIDDAVITGSANSTKAAQVDNIENINILRDPHIVEEHRQEFTRLKKYCVECKK